MKSAKKTAVIVLSGAGLALARRIQDDRPEETLIFGPSCVIGACAGVGSESSPLFPTEDPGLFGWTGPLRKVFPILWNEFDAIIAVTALGIVVRLVGPLAVDKRRDPAVVVVDDAGRFAISVLGGHDAGGNGLARRVAQTLGATLVITTASEAHGVPAVDLIGKRFGWTIERAENLTRAAAAVVRRERVAVFQDAGETDWWQEFGEWPTHFSRVDDLASFLDPEIDAALVITDRIVDAAAIPLDRSLIYRPRSLVAGIGCKRGTSQATIETWVEQVFTQRGLSTRSLAALATVALKADEPGLVAFAESRGIPLLVFSADELESQPGVETPSERVRARVGIPAVSEPSALRGAGAARLLVTKQIGPGVTVSIARKPSRG